LPYLSELSVSDPEIRLYQGEDKTNEHHLKE